MKLTIKLDLYIEVVVPEKSDRSLFSAIIADNQVGLENLTAEKLNSLLVKEIPDDLARRLRKAGMKSYSFISKQQLLAGG